MAAVYCKPRPVGGVSAIAVLLSVLLGWADHIWLSTEHVIWITAVVIVSVVNATIVAVVSPAIRRHQPQP